MTEPMTAAEYRNEVGVPRTILGGRLLAALEEREALLGERAEWGKLSGQTIQDAAVGALVRRIYNHPACKQRDWAFAHLRWANPVNPDSLRDAIAYLDSLLPKEPEVAPSGWTYERMTGGNGKPWVGIRDDHGDKVAEVPTQNAIEVPPCDRAFVAALLARQEGKGNE